MFLTFHAMHAQKKTQLQAPEDIEGGAERRCTDVLFMIILVIAWLAMTYLGVDAMRNGDPDVLVNGIDYAGRICGVDDAVKDKSKVSYSQKVRFDGSGVSSHTAFGCT